MSVKFKSKSHEKRLALSKVTCYATYLHTVYIRFINTNYVRKRIKLKNVLEEQTVKMRIRL